MLVDHFERESLELEPVAVVAAFVDVVVAVAVVVAAVGLALGFV